MGHVLNDILFLVQLHLCATPTPPPPGITCGFIYMHMHGAHIPSHLLQHNAYHILSHLAYHTSSLLRYMVAKRYARHLGTVLHMASIST